MDESLHDPWLRLTWHRLLALFQKRRRDRTPYETELEDLVTLLRQQLQAAQEDLARSLQTGHELRSRLTVAQVEVEALTEVVARDRKRVEAETATYARKIALATSFNQPVQG